MLRMANKRLHGERSVASLLAYVENGMETPDKVATIARRLVTRKLQAVAGRRAPLAPAWVLEQLMAGASEAPSSAGRTACFEGWPDVSGSADVGRSRGWSGRVQAFERGLLHRELGLRGWIGPSSCPRTRASGR